MASTKSAGYKLASYQSADGPRAGLVVDDKVFDAAKLTGKAAYASVIGILEDWKTAEGRAEDGRRRGGQEPRQGPAAARAPSCSLRCCGLRPSSAPAPIMPIMWRR